MNEVEFEKYINNNVRTLWPDVEDVPGKRVALKVDSGPGRMNIDLLARLRLIGIYLYPGVPNTTTVTQETDRNYGPFKNAYRRNLLKLSQARFDMKHGLKGSDIPLLVFGGIDDITGIELEDAFNLSFNRESNLSAWKKVGAVPLTRACLLDSKVRHEVVFGSNGEVDLTMDPKAGHYLLLEQLNDIAVTILNMKNMDGEELRARAPTNTTVAATRVTVANTKERVDALKNSKTASSFFYATGVEHLNQEDLFRAKEGEQRDKKVADVESEKQKRLAALDREEKAKKVLEENEINEGSGWDVSRLNVANLKIVCKWKKNGSKVPTKKSDLVDCWNDNDMPGAAVPWSAEEEASLQALKSNDIALKDTDLGAQQRQMVNAVSNCVLQGKLTQEQIHRLEQSLRENAIREAQSVPVDEQVGV